MLHGIVQEEVLEAAHCLVLDFGIVILDHFALDVDQLNELGGRRLLHGGGVLRDPGIELVHGLHALVPVMCVALLNYGFEFVHDGWVNGLRHRSLAFLEAGVMRCVCHAEGVTLHVVAVDGARAGVHGGSMCASAQEGLLHLLICEVL